MESQKFPGEYPVSLREEVEENKAKLWWAEIGFVKLMVKVICNLYLGTWATSPS